MIRKTFVINGVQRTMMVNENETLATFLRERLLLTGCKIGCGEGHCGACNVIVDGKVARSCLMKLSKIKDGAEITTIEGIGTISDMHPLQVAWMAHGCAQCGFCSPGFIMTAKVLLDNNNAPTREEVRDWFQKNRNLCRCTGYKPLVDAVMDAARVYRGEITKEDLVFKPTGDSIIGTKYVRPSAAQKVMGTWDFGADDALKMPEGTLRLALVQANVSHALLKGVDTAEAEKMPGVYKIITAKDIVAAGGKNRINGLVMLPLNNKCDGWDRPVLCDEKIFQFGDAIAIVAADKLLERAADYENTEDLTAALTAAKAVYANTSATQTEVDRAASTLLDALAAMAERADLAALKKLVASAGGLEEKDFTSDSYKDLKDAMDAAKDVIDVLSRTPEAIGKAYADIITAITNLERVGNKAALVAVIAKAEAIVAAKDSYVSSTLNGLEEALAAGKAVNDNPDALQDAINNAVTLLTEKVANVRLLGDVNNDGSVTTADSALLLRSAAELDTLDDAATVSADMNQDGIADTSDAVLILQTAAEF